MSDYKAPFPWFGGKSGACKLVWHAFGDVRNYVEPFAGSAANGENPKLRIVICGHAGEHDALLSKGWTKRKWAARKGYATTDEAVANSASETIWCSPHCIAEVNAATINLFA